MCECCWRLSRCPCNDAVDTSDNECVDTYTTDETTATDIRVQVDVPRNDLSVGEPVDAEAPNELIGTGAFSTVSLGRHGVVVKRSLPEHVAMLHHEFCIMQRLQPTRHVVAPLGFWCDHHYGRMLVEFGGTDMYELLPIGEYALKTSYTLQLAEALQHIHSCHVAHLDLKPENIVVDSVGQLRLIDFGLSRSIEPDSELCVFVGSATYASPEVLAQRPYLGVPADLWSFGVIIFVIWFGRQPWHCAMRSDQYYRKFCEVLAAGGTVHPLYSIYPLCRETRTPAWMWDVCGATLQPNPTARVAPWHMLDGQAPLLAHDKNTSHGMEAE